MARKKKQKTLRGPRDSFRTACQPIRGQQAVQRDCGDDSAGAHLFPFRTEKLRPAAPMVLPEEGGRVGRRPMPQASSSRGGFFLLKTLRSLMSLRTLKPLQKTVLHPFLFSDRSRYIRSVKPPLLMKSLLKRCSCLNNR